MMNLLPHHRFHIPNSLAIFAAVLLLVTSVVGFETNQEKVRPGIGREAGLGQINFSGQESTTSIKAGSDSNDSISDSAEHKRRGLNLGLLLFRRG